MTIEITTLDNGMRVVTETVPQLETATVGVWADVGARHEDAGINGIAHMLEHMAFKGTKRRTARGIAEEIENVGGYLNAYTSRENTVYYARVLKDDVGLGVDILSDILLNSTFEADELERERQVILQEIGQANDTPDDIVFDMLQEATYPDQAMGRPILGTNETVSNMTRDQLAGYIDTHYRGERLVMVGVGKVDHQDLVKRALDTFGKTTAGARPAPDAAIYTGGERRVERVLEQAHVTLGFNGLGFDDPDYYAFQVYSTVLGGGMSSRLFQEVREERGLAYSVYSFAHGFVDGGEFGVYAGTGEKEVAELIPVIAGEMNSLAAKAGADEVARGRAQLKAGLLMSLESSSSRMDQIGRQMLIFNRIIPIEEMVASIDAVDEAAVERMAARVLQAGPLALAAIGPLGALESYDKIADRFK